MRVDRRSFPNPGVLALVRLTLAMALVVGACSAGVPAAQAASFGSVSTFNGTSSEFPRSAVIDAAGNTYIVGAFSGSADFDPGPGMASLTAAGIPDLFVVKLNSAGVLVWAHRIGAATRDVSPTGIALGNAGGSLYITGSFNGTVNFNPGGNAPMTAIGDRDAFLLILNVDGSYATALQFGGPTAVTIARAVAVDAFDQIYLVGSFTRTVDFDPNGTTSTLTAVGTVPDAFALKLDFARRLVWADAFGGPGFYDLALAVTVDNLGNAFVAGQFEATVDFDPSSSGFDYRSAAGVYDAFVLKLDAAGHPVWVDTFGGVNGDVASALAVDGAGNVYVSGYFYAAADFDPGPGQRRIATHGDSQPDAFLLKLDSGGGFTWVATIGGAVALFAHGVALDASGNVYQVGSFFGTADLDPGPGQVTRTTTGEDGFVLKLDADGHFVSVDQLTAPGNPNGAIRPLGVLLDASANVIAFGQYDGAADFDPGSGVVTRPSLGGGDAFVLTLTQKTAPVNGLPGSQSILKDTPLVLSTAKSNGIGVADGDAGSSPLKITLGVTNGTVTLSGTAGLSFTAGDGTADQTVTFTGTLASINAALDGVAFTPSAGFTGNALLQITSFDQVGPTGGQTDVDALTITVREPNQRPSAVDDVYSMSGQASLAVSAPGVLANDADPDGTSLLQAQIVSKPSQGSVSLKPDGSFTYAPNAGFAGTDTFTYQASDGALTSPAATVNVSVTTSPCTPRPKVQSNPVPGAGKLQVHVEATPMNTGQNNRLQSVTVGTLQNAKVTLNGQVLTSGQTYAVPANTVGVDFTVERETPGQPTTVPLTVVDGCGSWPTFVGGGAAAGF
jgi:hypothetical protein